MALGTTAAALLTLGGIGASYGISKITAPKAQAMPQLPSLPSAPKADDAVAKAADTISKRKAATTQTIYTSPLGVSGEAGVVRKTLLGQ